MGQIDLRIGGNDAAESAERAQFKLQRQILGCAESAEFQAQVEDVVRKGDVCLPGVLGARIAGRTHAIDRLFERLPQIVDRLTRLPFEGIDEVTE